MKEYEVVYERTEKYREVFKVKANSPEQASEEAKELCDDHDWTENEVIYGDEDEIQVREING